MDTSFDQTNAVQLHTTASASSVGIVLCMNKAANIHIQLIVVLSYHCSVNSVSTISTPQPQITFIAHWAGGQ